MNSFEKEIKEPYVYAARDLRMDASIVKYTGPPLNAKGTDVAIEELVLSCGRIEVKP